MTDESSDPSDGVWVLLYLILLLWAIITGVGVMAVVHAL